MTKPAPLRVEDIPDHPDFSRIGAAIELDLRYVGAANFAGRSLYGDLDCAWLRREAARALDAAAAWLGARHPGWRLRLLDALRPQRVQEAIWRDVAGTPMARYFAPPERGSIHSWGMAVDVTLLDANGAEVDMGSGYDEMSPASHPALHAELLASGRLTPAQVALRDRLRDAMRAGGYAGIDLEWWHFELGERERVRGELPRVD
ncbi:MAG: D-alanyl-D-alanine dipeptidase [Burkholderiales bacterium]|nr:D-alanyl-D-alanine dipeptidase [Burkholderiales bacterium]MDE1928065.1 D-alanyl-D-alanine dipeptidase [Burkholderiales bacterium]MDE2157719.1 D-alanyl-D-alanine dipeptidase [Burkholderiales bacterium]